MGNTKQSNIKNHTYDFFNDMINIENINPNSLKIDKKSYKSIGIYYIDNIKVDEYIKEENAKKYLAFASTVVLETYAEQWNKIKSLIKKISDKPGDYDEKYIKIRFNSDNKFRLNKIQKLHNLKIIVRSIFKEDNKYYLQCFLGECLHEL